MKDALRITSKKSRSMSYSGCWTCRERRIKCDERAVTCQNCGDAGLTCGGYDIRLNWCPGLNGNMKRAAGNRTAIKPIKRFCGPLTENEILRKLYEVDNKANENETCSGPFSVFRVQSNSLSSNPPTLKTPLTEHNTQSRRISLDKDDESLYGTSLGVIYRESSPEAYWNLNEHLSIELESQTPDPNPDIWNLFFPNIQITGFKRYKDLEFPGSKELASSGFCYDLDSEIGISPGVNAQEKPHQIPAPSECSSPPTSTIDPCSVNEQSSAVSSRLLMHHYTEQIVHLMQPVLHNASPFQTIYLRLAIEGLSDIGTTENLKSASPAGKAVAHALMCATATFMQWLEPKGKYFRQIAFHHKQQALISLRNTLSAKMSTYRNTMTAILCMVSADVFDGGIGDHWVHLNAAIEYQTFQHNATLLSRETRQLNSICMMLQLFAQTALANPSPVLGETGNELLNCDEWNSLDPSVEYLYGITTQIARTIARVFRLTQFTRAFGSGPYPEFFLEACEDVLDELCSWQSHSEPFWTIERDQENSLQIAQAQAKAFHYASRIYYFRSVQKCRKDILHAEQGATISAMNEAEDIKKSIPNSNLAPAPITWPAFVASCEAIGEDRKLWEGWWKRVESYRMKSFSTQRDVIHRVWLELENSEPEMDWREVLAKLDLRIIPV